MLSSILKKESCAACRFCCAFRRQSLWEVPIFTKENKEAIEKNSSLDASVLIPVSDGLFGDVKGDFADSAKHFYQDIDQDKFMSYILNVTPGLLFMDTI